MSSMIPAVQGRALPERTPDTMWHRFFRVDYPECPRCERVDEAVTTALVLGGIVHDDWR
jgi:hypothetical protein